MSIRSMWLGVVGAVALFVLAPMASAQPTAQGYKTNDTIRSGMIVRIDESDPSLVQIAGAEDVESLLGVAIDPNAAPLTITGDDTTVLVATTGQYEVLVSDQSGAITPDDYVTISAVEGIGMKAGDSQERIVGRALSFFDGQSGVLSRETTTTENGTQQQIAIGTVLVEVNVAANPLLRTSIAGVPSFLTTASEAIAQKTVQPFRLYVSLVVLFVTVAISGSMLYGGVRNAIISIGRNPLSRRSIMRALAQVALTSLIVFIIGLFGVYLILRL